MNIFKKLFGKHNKEGNDENSISKRGDFDFSDSQQRSRFVMDCLEQMEEGSREVELLTGEYSLITDYLTDIEEIEALPENRLKELEKTANELVGFDNEIKKFREKKNRMSDIEYYTIRKQDDEVEEGIKNIREAEKYAVLVKKDLRRLDGERQAMEFRKHENRKRMTNLKGMVTIFISAYVLCMLLLLVFQFGFKLEVFIGYFLATALVAIACAFVAIKYMDAGRELKKTIAEINKLIQLQNTVKIRYVNNRKLLEYLYLKYHVENGEKLDKLWIAYQKEKEERRQFTEAEAKYEFYTKQLISMLSSVRIKYPDRWLYQIRAFIDKREMVEIRHELILKRQGIREKIETSRKLAENARDEIKDVVKLYPEYAREILELVDNEDTK